MDSGLSIIPMDLRHIQSVRGGPVRHSVDNSSPGICIPPTTVLPEVVEIPRSFRGQRTLIAPYWPDAPWFPFMLERDPDPVPLPEDYFSVKKLLEGNPDTKISNVSTFMLGDYLVRIGQNGSLRGYGKFGTKLPQA